MAEDRGIWLIPHGWNTAVGLAADLHLASASRTTDLVEYLTGSPFIDEIVESRWKLDCAGMLAIPDIPGLGISLNLDAVEKYTGVKFQPS
jgi:L-alanine-DL-glutamate epimerase-like enolase superfamily enzyme